MASPKAASSVRPLLRVGRYEIYEKIASGGMAAVHVGVLVVGPASGMARPVAIKRLHPHLAEDPEFVAMFLDEAKLAARLTHPNVVPTLDVITQGKEVFLVMEYVAGESLATVLRLLNERKQAPPVEIVAAVVADALQGLGAAHRATNELGVPLGIVHRDISPQNIMVGTDGFSRVLDFGIAKATDRAQYTREGQIRGKLAYMAPEQLRGTPASARTDLFSMGVTLWESLTARRLFHATTDARLVARVLECEVRPPSEYNPRIPPALDRLLARALHRDPEARFQTADEMASALEAAARPTLRRDVGSWLQGLAGESLDRRAVQIQAFERAVAQRHAAGAAPAGAREAARPRGQAAAKPAGPRSGKPPASGTMPTLLSPNPPGSPAPVRRGSAPTINIIEPKPPPPYPNHPALGRPPYPSQPATRLPYPSHPAPPRQGHPWREQPPTPARSSPYVPEPRLSPTSLLVSQGRALVMPPGALLQPPATAVSPPAKPSASKRLLPSRRYGGLILAAGVLLGGLLARAFLLYREAAPPPTEGPAPIEAPTAEPPPR